ncbi:MAG: tRNA uridine-5-carboxymethylaminomethyl(34) synthesis GTPase MnmE [Clostridia bacterium]|jgi:tRNA modification GTPase|nr:tRNA uridine-5-carboxymethylaminomethyl(34) synthesis GTPase MnmE [Clostridia bacterium]
MSTIVAISTAPGIGGIGIIRMSGKDCFKVLDKIFKPINKSVEKGYTIKYGKILDGEETIDEVLVSYFLEPRSYTTENMCEINSHGGNIIMRKILDLCLKNGAELAEPGEFTKRAFLNGRIDLTQAEAVIDVINSKSDKEAEASINQLEGNLSKKIKEIREDLISGLADIEVSIDYPEYDEVEITNKKIIDILEKNEKKLIKLEKSFINGKILREGVKTAIIGRPNAGKSSLLNLFLNEERAIVTDIEGTTRDTIEEYMTIGGVPFKIIDTAGIRDTNDTVEKIGVKKAIDIANKSDLIIAIFDITREINDEDRNILQILKNKNSIILLNKIDLNDQKVEDKIFYEYSKNIVKISTKTQDGFEDLIKIMQKLTEMEEINIDGENIIINSRHRALIVRAEESLKKAKETLENGMPIDVISIYIKEILEELGKITGESVTDDVISEIFSKFCLGK